MAIAEYVKIDRTTGAVLDRASFDAPVRALHKTQVWLPVAAGTKPSFDPTTQRLKIDEAVGDLPGHSEPVPEDARMNHEWTVVALTEQERNERMGAAIDALNCGLMRVVEDLVVAVRTGGSLPQIAVDKINARRTLRGQEPI